MAIAFDATSSGTGFVTTSVTFSHTCTGSDRILFVSTSYFQNSNESPSGITYNSVALTKIADYQPPSLALTHSLWYLLAPATGSNTVAVTFPSNKNNIACIAASYTGALQSGVPDATATAEHGFGGSDLTTSVTTVADNCWVVEVAGTDQVTVSMSAGTATTERNEAITTGTQHAAFYDSNGPKTPAGSRSLVVSLSGSSNIASIAASFAPAGGGGAAFVAGKPVELLQAVKRASEW